MTSQRVVEVAPERLAGWLERFAANNPEGPQRIGAIERFDRAPVAVLLIRRGGYAVGLADGWNAWVAHKVGSRRVQSRTAAGGWSQQRFARRRANQADELVMAVRDHAVRVFGDGAIGALVLGGDRTLVHEVLEDRRLLRLHGLPTRAFYDIADPNRAVLDATLTRARAARVSIEE